MGRELQKKKNKSGLRKVRRSSKKTSKPLLANAIIAKHWDRNQTLTQNYARLGLTAKINAPTGGSEDPLLHPSNPSKTNSRFSINGKPTQFAPVEVRIERDPKTGAILRLIDDPNAARDAASRGEGYEGPWKPLNDPLDDLDAMVSMNQGDMFEGFDDENENEEVPNAASIVRDLEAQAARPAGKDKRKQSDRERAFLKRLIDKHGVDEEKGCFDRMARDGDINIMQQSAGDLRKRVRRYLAENGA